MIFVLGVERSATTWITNILDHHPATEVFMEPLSQFIWGFEEWPGRFEHINDIEAKAEYFEQEFEKLKMHRQFLITLFSDSAWAWNADLSLVQRLAQKGLASPRIRNFLELNYHRKGQEVVVQKKPPLETVIKELRLNFNAALVAALDPEAMVLIPIREAASCIRSVREQMERGHLVELKKQLEHHYGEITLQTICRYWVESNTVLLEEVQKANIKFKVVSHTALLESPRGTVESLLQFLHLPIAPSVINFLTYSDQPGSGKHSTKRSRDELLKQMQDDREQIYPAVESELAAIKSHPILKKYI